MTIAVGRFKIALLGGLWLATSSCGSDRENGDLRTLTIEDVGSLPVGDAIGEAFSGIYVLDSSEQLGCACRVGSCSKWSADKVGSFTLTQTDGVLNVVLRGQYNDTLYDGGVNSDGSFIVGGGPNAESIQGYALLTGTVVAASSIRAESENSVVGQIAGDDYDCDLRAKLTGSFVVPLP